MNLISPDISKSKVVIGGIYALGIGGAVAATMIPAVAGTLGVVGAAAAGFVGGAVLAPAVTVAAIAGTFLLGKELIKIGQRAFKGLVPLVGMLTMVALQSVLTPWVSLYKRLRREKAPAKKAVAPQQASTFKDASIQQGFNNAAPAPKQASAQEAPSRKPKGNTP